MVFLRKPIAMKSSLLSIFFLLLMNTSFSQNLSRCVTDEQFARLSKEIPGLTNRVKATQADAFHSLRGSGSQNSVQSVITIPVVVHVLYHNANENISNTQIQSQIDVLNEDFRRLNADTNVTRNIFKPVAGDAQFQFCLAQRDPAGNVTDGITRNYCSQTSWGCVDSMKVTAYGGVDGWPGDSYLNIWVCNLNCANGYAYYPGTPDPYDGIVVHYYVFGRVGNIAPGYSGRTATHEVGHYLGLYHPFDYGQCVGTSPNDCGSSGDRICDTPASDYPAYGCDTTLNSCTDILIDLPNQIENYMDYADDNCKNMFSLDQISRMHALTNSYRQSLLTSPACISPLITYYDAALLEIDKPFKEICEPILTPRIKMGSISSNTLTSADIYYSLDGAAYTNYSWSGALQTGYSTWITLPTLTVSPGSHTLDCYVTNPNGLTDQNAWNDSISITFTNLISGNGLPLPFTEDFEGGLFPPEGWFLTNPDYDRVWERTTETGGLGQSMACALFRNFYNGSVGTHDGLLTPKFDYSNVLSSSISFDVAYADPASTFYSDTLKLWYSLDCGESWSWIWSKGGNQLSTAPTPLVFGEFLPDSSQWRNEVISLPTLAGNPLVTFKFENVSRWSNNLYVDNINLTGLMGIEEYPLSRINIYPNPANEKATLVYDFNCENSGGLRIINALGKIVFSHKIFEEKAQYEFSTSGYLPGVYHCTVNCNENTIANIKLVIIR